VDPVPAYRYLVICLVLPHLAEKQETTV